MKRKLSPEFVLVATLSLMGVAANHYCGWYRSKWELVRQV